MTPSRSILAAYREPLLLAALATVLIAAAVTTVWLALLVPVALALEWYALRGSRGDFDVTAYVLTDEEQQRLDQAAALYVDARRGLNRFESMIRERGYRIDGQTIVPEDDHGRELQIQFDAARGALDPEAVLRLSRLPVERADRALCDHAGREAARWGLLVFPIATLLSLPLGRYALICGGAVSCLAFMLASHFASRRVVNFLLSLPQAMPRFERDQERREQIRAAAASLARSRQQRG